MSQTDFLEIPFKALGRIRVRAARAGGERSNPEQKTEPTPRFSQAPHFRSLLRYYSSVGWQVRPLPAPPGEPPDIINVVGEP
jgi:hypothetical protein